MTFAPRDANQTHPFRLRAFGPPALLDGDGKTLVGQTGQQRRRLALLAVLAAAGERGRTRDQLLLLFWPDSTQAKARHSLEQLVYAIRNSVHEQIFAGTNPLRLNDLVVQSDVAEFSDALARGEPEIAVERYSGPFLDGFYLSEAPEFEQWMNAERARLGRSYATALEQLARAAGSAGDHAAEAKWWRTLSDADPLNSNAALGLIRALTHAGDYPAALRHAEQYQRNVRRELGAAPGPELAQLVEEIRGRAEALPASRAALRAPAETQAQPTGKRSDSEPIASSAPGEPTQPVPREAAAPRSAEPLAASKRTRPARGRVLLAAVALLSVLALFATLARRQTADTAARAAPASPGASVAVLPLANVTNAAEDAAIVDGITEELIGTLSRIEGLRVVARTSSFVFRNRDLNARQIADSLGVTHLLEGGVQKSGDRLRVQVRLIDARDGSTRWSERYDRELRDVFEMQSDIALAVARELDVRLRRETASALRHAPMRNVAAYELYLRGRDPVHFRTADGPLRALDYLRQAVALDSNFAAAYANMAYMYHVYGTRGSGLGVLGGGPAESDYARLARVAAQKAVELDPALPESQTAVGVAHLSRGDLRAAEEAFKRAISLPGYSRAREHLAHIYQWTGRPAEALAENLRAVHEDPLSPTAIADLGRALCMMDRTDEGLAQLARVADLQPPLRRHRVYEFWCHAMKRDWYAALRAAEQIPGQRSSGYRGYALALLGRSADATAIRDSLLKAPTPSAQFNLAMVSVGLGDYESALLWLERSFASGGYSSEIMYPVYADLHAQPEFERIRRLQLSRSSR